MIVQPGRGTDGSIYGTSFVHDQSSFKDGLLIIGPAVDFEALATETANKITEKETQVQELETTKQSVDDVTAKIDAVVGGARSILNIMDIIRQTCQRCLTGFNLQRSVSLFKGSLLAWCFVVT